MNHSLKMEDPFPPSSNYSFLDQLDHYTITHETSILREFSELVAADTPTTTSSLGFMDLLNMHDFAPPTSTSTSTFLTAPPPSLQRRPFLYNHDQAPPTPNSSSISSESNDDHTNKHLLLDGEEPQPQPQPQDDDDDDDDDVDDQDEEDQNNKTKKQLKPAKKAIQKRKREPRFAFMTKSEVDHLEDGYRWRKYGQKAVKNSAFPRSYYRCTSASCDVKKRVERCWNDPSIVVTTYEGQHTHPSPMMQRSSAWQSPPTPHMPPNTLSQGFLFNAQRQQSCHHMLTDHGLLQDVVPSSLIIKKEDK